MQKQLLSLAFSLMLGQAFGQTYLQKGSLKQILAATPKGYTVLDSASGDLNRDAHPDFILVYKKSQESDDMDNPSPRPLLLYLGQADKTYQLASSNDKVVLCSQCGGVMGDPYSALAVKNGFFTVEHMGGSSWRWTRFITFKYNTKDKKWYLHKDGGEYFHASEPEKSETKIKTSKDFGKILFEQFDYNKE
jgi:hypothetical protein